MVCFVTNIEWSIFNWNLFYGYYVLESPKEQGIHYTRITKKNIPLIQDTQLPHTKEILHCDPLDKHWRTMPSHKKFCCGLERKNHETRGSPLSTSKMLACKCEGFLADFRVSTFLKQESENSDFLRSDSYEKYLSAMSSKLLERGNEGDTLHSWIWHPIS